MKNFILQIIKLCQKDIRGFSLNFEFEIKESHKSFLKLIFNSILKLRKDVCWNIQNPLITQWQDTLINIPFANIEDFDLSYFTGLYPIGVRNVQIIKKIKKFIRFSFY